MIAARSLVFGLITVGLTVLAHAAAGGGVPPVTSLLVLVLVTAAVGYPLLRRIWRPAALPVAIGAAQVGLHPVFEALAQSGGTGHAAHTAAPAMLGAHVVAGMLGALLVTALDPVLRCLRLRGARLVRVPVAAAVEPRAPEPVRSAPPSLTPRVVSIAAPRPPCGVDPPVVSDRADVGATPTARSAEPRTDIPVCERSRSRLIYPFPAPFCPVS